MIGGINTWAVDVVRYSAGVVDWTIEEMASMDRRTRKILTTNGCLHQEKCSQAVSAEKGRGKRIDWKQGVCKEGKKIHVWLPKGEDRVDASGGAEGKGGC